MFAFVFQEACTTKKRLADMAPGGVKAQKKAALAVPPAPGVTTRRRKDLQTKEACRDGSADGIPGNRDKRTRPLPVGKCLGQLNCYLTSICLFMLNSSTF